MASTPAGSSNAGRSRRVGDEVVVRAARRPSHLEFVTVDNGIAVRWRRIGTHQVFGRP